MAQDSHSQNNVLVDIKGLKTHFEVGSKGIIFGLGASRNIVRAVDGVDLTIREGETLGLVGESGCGKSTLGYSILQLEKPTGGTVSFEGTDLTKLKKSEIRPFRKKMQIVFQDPAAALDPRQTVGEAIAEPIRIHRIVEDDEVEDRVEELLKTVGLNPYFKKQVSARIQRRPAAAHSHSEGAVGQSNVHRRGRADLGIGRVDSGSDHQPAGGTAGPISVDVPIHLPRPQGCAPHQRPRGGDVSR